MKNSTVNSYLKNILTIAGIVLICLILQSSSASAQQLNITLKTGSDDLRGGNDNINLVIVTDTGRLIRFDNINNRKRWADNSVNTIVRTLPSGVAPENVSAVRFETTASGGAGGDNWNLNELKIVATGRGRTRVLLDERGNPLFRFTGDDRVREFRINSADAPPAKKVMTNFKPELHGYKFINEFKNIFISEIDFTTGGLCGGMVYSALDYFRNPKKIPTQNYMPAEGTPLQSYIYNRQVDSIMNNLDRWGEVGLNPGGVRNDEFYRWGLQMGSGRLGELIAKIDRNIPVPLGLQSCAGAGCRGNHQVLAIGYELGRYNGDMKNNVEDIKIYLYDPNYPNEIVTLTPEPDKKRYKYIEKSKRYQTYFVDQNYSRKEPLAVSTKKVDELIVRFETGNDDLRGGRDNVNLIFHLRSGKTFRFNNVNGGKRWINGSSQTINKPLPVGIRARDISGVTVETTFGGGLGGDNWNLKSLRISSSTGGKTATLFSRDSGRSEYLHRFTGDSKTWRADF